MDTIEESLAWTQTAEPVRNRIPAMSPRPGALSKAFLGNKEENIKLFRAEATTDTGSPGMLLSEDMRIACGAGAIQVLQGERSGKTVMSGRELVRGTMLAPAAIFTHSLGPAFVPQSSVLV